MSLPAIPPDQPPIGPDQIANASPAPRPHEDWVQTIRDLYEAFQNGQMTNQRRYNVGKNFITNVLVHALNEPDLKEEDEKVIRRLAGRTAAVRPPMPSLIATRTEMMPVARLVDAAPSGAQDDFPFDHFTEGNTFVMERGYGERVDQLIPMVAEAAYIAEHFGYILHEKFGSQGLRTFSLEEDDEDEDEKEEGERTPPAERGEQRDGQDREEL